MPQSENLLLSSLPPNVFGALEPHLKRATLGLGNGVAETGGQIRVVYFPLRGVISLVVPLNEGDAENCVLNFCRFRRRASHREPSTMEPGTMTKAKKSKEELRQMILKEGKASSRAWPPGMDVSVRATASGWRVDCLPPTASRLAFTDCCDEVASIALRLRADFDLIN